MLHAQRQRDGAVVVLALVVIEPVCVRAGLADADVRQLVEQGLVVRECQRQALVSTNYKLSFEEPKTDRGRRSLKLDAETVAALHLDQQADDMAKAGGAYQDHGLVFANEDGSPKHPVLLSQEFERHVRDAALPPVRFHDLRHTYATLALQAGINVKMVSARLGHSTVAFTLDVYSHAIPEMDEQAAEIFSMFMRGASHIRSSARSARQR